MKKSPTDFDKTAVFTQYHQKQAGDFFQIFLGFSEKLSITVAKVCAIGNNFAHSQKFVCGKKCEIYAIFLVQDLFYLKAIVDGANSVLFSFGLERTLAIATLIGLPNYFCSF